MIWVDYFALIAGILLALVVLLMHSSDDIKDAFSGEKSELFKNRKTRGLELFLNRAAGVLAVVLVVAVLLSNNLR